MRSLNIKNANRKKAEKQKVGKRHGMPEGGVQIVSWDVSV